MGCASSSPLVESGRHFVDTAKESAGDVMAKGEKTLQEVGDTAKDTLTSGMDHVKEAMESAMNTAEDSIGSVVGKIGNTFHTTTAQTANTAMAEIDSGLSAVDDSLKATEDSMTEAVSEAETVLASEAESAKEAIDMFERVDAKEGALNLKSDIGDGLMIEDIEQQHFDMLGDDVAMVNAQQRKVEEIVNQLPMRSSMSPPIVSPITEPKKELPPPTLWEAAADAILLQKTIKSLEAGTREPTTYFHIEQQTPTAAVAERPVLNGDKIDVVMMEHQLDSNRDVIRGVENHHENLMMDVIISDKD